ncbi:hypothetical protein GDO86_011814 [Hymenochirus boettgeri]|uniref:SAM domain-containing protein n=1 Tax=Hymenochirus boettgeri TaxID=247094 RepID=A0A8T2JHU7_9PIPI|nr:hypothetical protein GDO86_011814 [Hymenochirus boettgeri]
MELPTKVEDWTKDDVKHWVTENLKFGVDEGEILYKQNVNGEVLKILSIKHLTDVGITLGSAVLITDRIKKYSENVKTGSNFMDNQKNETKKKKNQKKGDKDLEERTHGETNETKCNDKAASTKANIDIDSTSNVTCAPYPFDCTHECKMYTQHHFLQPESGISNYIDPVHEYKAFTNTENATEMDKKMKFCNEVFRFAAACMNVRTNGTIHFGVRDKPHGEIIGIVIDKSNYGKYFEQMISKYFTENQLSIAKNCIRPPRFVDVLYQQNTHSDLVVLEVDVVPNFSFCNTQIFSTYQQELIGNTWKISKVKRCFIRDGESSRDILANAQHNEADIKEFYSNVKLRDNARKMAEENYKIKQRQKRDEGPMLVSLITGNRGLIDNSYYKWYILVTNKYHYQIENVNSEALEELKLYQQTSWIFCNGRTDLDCKNYDPLTYSQWHKEKAAGVRKLITFLSRKDIMERGKFLVIFLLLSPVEDPADPMIEVFSTFYQELNGIDDILCICEKEQIFVKWTDLLRSRCIEPEEMEKRCIYNLGIEKVNGTLLKLKSTKQSSCRFLPSSGSSSTVLQRKCEDLMSTLDILCSNQCQDTEIEKNESEFSTFRRIQEEQFYRGGKASWWNFYFSMKYYTGPFIKRDIHDQLIQLIESSSQCDKQISVKVITLYHNPGCGGSTSGMHVLWELREKFRCATLQRKSDEFANIAIDVTELATYGSPNSTDYFPVLLLIDDYEEEENVYILQNSIISEISAKGIRYGKPVVIILNCMRSQKSEQSSKSNCTESVALVHKLSPKEQRAFETKLKEIEKEHKKPDDFYSFMIMKSNFDKEYIQNVVRNTLKGLNTSSKEAQLISFLALLNKYVKDSTISASMCEVFLGITARIGYLRYESIEEKMRNYFSIILQTEVEEYGRYQGLRIIHPLIASCCVEELKKSYGINQSKIMKELLNTNIFYDYGIGRDIISQNIQSMLLTRQRKEHGDETDTLFSPLIEELHKEEGSVSVERVLREGSHRFTQNPFICQALARHFYIRERNFDSAFHWAKKAKNIAPSNSFILDTLGQIYKTQLKKQIDDQNKNSAISAQLLKILLETAKSASEAFKECQKQAEKTEAERELMESTKTKRYNVYNTAGYLGQIEVCLYTVDILFKLTSFHTKNVLSKKHLVQFLSGECDTSTCSSCSASGEELYNVLRDYQGFLTKIKPHLMNAFNFFKVYFVYLKPRNILKEGAEYKIRKKVSDLFEQYTQTFGEFDLKEINERIRQNGISVLSRGEIRFFLESFEGDSFPGILKYLTGHDNDVKNMEKIVKTQGYLLSVRPDQDNLRTQQNYILANIVLCCILPNSNEIKTAETLKRYLREILEKVGNSHRDFEPYFLASMLFWPQNLHELDNDSKHLAKYVACMGKYFKKQYRRLLWAKQPIAHFYLGKENGLKRLIHKGKIDQCFSRVHPSDLNSLWQSGDIWKEREVRDLLVRVNGRTEGNWIYVECGKQQEIPIRPAHLGQLRNGKSIERVSFYLGFSIEGLIAYNIESN